MRRTLIAGNWKSNLLQNEAENLAQILSQGQLPTTCDVAVFPPEVFLSLIAKICHPTIKVGAQNCSSFPEGAYTGETTARQLKSAGINMMLVGHSERRMLFGETNSVVKTKVDRIIEADAIPVFCCGEPLEIRKANQQNKTVLKQLEEGLFHLSTIDFTKVIIAYEPVWAIGTGVVATPKQAEEMHQFIRLEIAKRYGESVAEQTTILYGGSVKPDNAKQLLSSTNIDGALVGGASLKADDFLAIVNAVK